MLSRLSIMKTHTGVFRTHTYENERTSVSVRPRKRIHASDSPNTSARILASSLTSWILSDAGFSSPQCLSSAIDEIWGVSNYAIGARPIKLPSCRRSPSPLSRSNRVRRESSHPFPSTCSPPGLSKANFTDRVAWCFDLRLISRSPTLLHVLHEKIQCNM